jgi:hypothetical protein
MAYFFLGRETCRKAAKSDPVAAGEHSELHATLFNFHRQYIRPSWNHLEKNAKCLLIYKQHGKIIEQKVWNMLVQQKGLNVRKSTCKNNKENSPHILNGSNVKRFVKYALLILYNHMYQSFYLWLICRWQDVVISTWKCFFFIFLINAYTLQFRKF